MSLYIFVLFVIINSVVCIEQNNDKKNFRQGYNHPPSAENYNPIPVSIIYGDDVIDGKSSEVKKEPMTTESTDVSTVSENNKSDSRLDDTQSQPKPRALGEYQIPVAVVYDGVPENRQASQVSATDNPKKRLKPSRRTINKSENEAMEELNNESLLIATSTIAPIKPRNQKVRPVKRQRQRVDFVNLQTSTAETAQLQPTQVESVEPHPQKAESTNPQIKIVDSGVKPQPRKIDTVNPTQDKEFVNQKPSSLVTKAKGEQRKRERDPVVRIIDSQNYVFAHNGNFHYSYEGADGTKAFSEGQLKTIEDDAGESVSGGFSYTDKEGNDFSLSYTADENGYRPVGAHLPTPPPIPPEIARALAYLATATTPEPVTKPSSTKKT